MADSRLLPVPDGLAGERLDAGVARLLGLSRTAVAAMVDAGDVLVDGIVGAPLAPAHGGQLAGRHAACAGRDRRR